MSTYIHTGRTADGIRRQQENGSRHKGRVRSDETRERMAKAATRWTGYRKPIVPIEAKQRAVALVQRGATHREAAAKAGISLGAVQRALRWL